MTKPNPSISTTTPRKNQTNPLNSRIFLKLENLQPSGSFKQRGIGNLVLSSLSSSSSSVEKTKTKTHFYSSSGGNAGLACVHAARTLGYPATVVVPHSTKPLMLAKLRAAGATQVLQHGDVWAEADAYLRDEILPRAREVGGEGAGVYVPPFDHEEVWKGNSGIVDSVATQLAELCGSNGGGEEGEDGQTCAPDVLICSVGGGGLFNGLVAGVDRMGGKWKDTTILAVETRGADSLHQSLVQGRHVTLPGITSLATSLGATRVSDKTYELASTKKQVSSVVLSDEEAAMGCWRLADDERLIVELACGVNVALCYGGRLAKALGRPVHKDEKVVIVVCGGSAVTVDQVAQWKKDYGHLGDEPSEKEQATVASAAAAAATNGSTH